MSNGVDDKKLQIMELFGPTIQGEGIMSGTVTHFLRTGGCSLRCSWCDSLFAVLPAEIKKHRTLMTTAEILDAIYKLPHAPYVTFTGGDPAIQERLGDIIPALNFAGMRIAIETQGMFFPEWLKNCDVLTFSPKGPSSGSIVDAGPLLKYLVSLGKIRPQEVCIKIVCFDEADYAYAKSVYDAIPSVYYDAFYFTAGTPVTPDLETRVNDVLQNQHALAEMMLKDSDHMNDKVHLGCQQHVLLWPSEDKGV